ncbi:MAG: putative glycosyl transferase, family 2 [Rhizobacter sp.]|nr:putative glycosyl transferase, family 2 [Rhizobacter sp.]
MRDESAQGEPDCSGSGWLLVTPARNEAHHLPELFASLLRQSVGVVERWVIVDDGSTDGTGTAVDAASATFPVTVLRREGSKGLATGGAFQAFIFGADEGLTLSPRSARVMKLDADVILSETYFERLLSIETGQGLLGGIVPRGGRDLEQKDHIPGFIKAYSRPAYEIVRELPRAIGMDIVDEPTLREAGLSVAVHPGAHVMLQRGIGESEGLHRGRWRNGRVSRWSGYDPAYFTLRLVRYISRKPVVSGAAAMAWGYVTAGRGPFPESSRRRFRQEQRAKLRQLARNPRVFARQLYGVNERCGDARCCGQP